MYWQVTPELFVDTTRGQKLKINVDISFARLPCVCKLLVYFVFIQHISYFIDWFVVDLSIDAMDVSGEQQVSIKLS